MLFSIMSNFQIHYLFKLDFQKGDQHTGGKWLIHGTIDHKDTQLQSLELPSESNMFNPICKDICRKPKVVVQNKIMVIKIPMITTTIMMK